MKRGCCYFCRRPLQLRQTIRPGGIPFTWLDCNCDEADIFSPAWSLRCASMADIYAFAEIFPDALYVALSRVMAA